MKHRPNLAGVRMRRRRRGTLLVVVLGLLVALFVIGTSFSYVTLTERRAAANYLDRQRALDLALDGVEYSIARLRAEAVQNHYEPLTEATFEYDPQQRDVNPEKFALGTLDTSDARVSWSRTVSATSLGGEQPDGDWVDFNGNGVMDGGETGHGGDKIGKVGKGSRGFAGTVTVFGGDGIGINEVPTDAAPYINGRNYGPSGTYEPLGDYARVKVVDAASMFNLNNFRDDRLKELLMVLGAEIDKWVAGRNAKGAYNPFPESIAEQVTELHANLNYHFSNKEQLRSLWDDQPHLYDLAMNFVTVDSWVDNHYLDYGEKNTEVSDSAERKDLTNQERWREGIASSSPTSGGRDGWGDWQPEPAYYGRSPINLNTAPKPVLVTLFAGMEARARLLYFRKASQITTVDALQLDLLGLSVSRMDSGTTDLCRQNSRSDLTSLKEGYWFPGSEDNQAIFQLVPIGPITAAVSTGATSTSSGSGSDYASKLADLVVELRKEHPFTSWQDFDYRFCQLRLLRLPADRSSVAIPDLVGAGRSDPADQGSVSPPSELPPAENVQHAANPFKSSDAAMSQTAFRAWYWKSVVDMIRANLNPNNVVSRYNADYPYHQNVDRMDLTVTTGPVCFSSMGVYEVISMGELLAPKIGGSRGATAATGAEDLAPVARRQVRTVVEIYSVLRHTSQADFMSPMDPEAVLGGQTAATTTTPDCVVALTRYGTKSGPYSIDERTAGVWNDKTDSDLPSDSEYLGARRIKGYNAYGAASSDYGYVALNPQDRSPFNLLETGTLNFHTRYNEGLNGRDMGLGDGVNLIQGVNSNSTAVRSNFGHAPWNANARFDDFISTASPRQTDPAIQGQTSEFDSADSGDEATRYATLQTDGVFLRGWHLRPRSQSDSALKNTYGTRGGVRTPRLKLLRYPCGANASDNPFDEIETGPVDTDQSGYGPDSGGTGYPNLRTRLGTTAGGYGTDNHNANVEDERQRLANMPYYEGTVDFWIKWDLTPQGRDDSAGTQETTCLGEIDPSSQNYSGLFGSTAYGRFANSTTYAPATTIRDINADFEGVQFFVYKEPGGILRFTRLYFAEAFGMDIQSGATGTGGGTLTRFGKAMRRILNVASGDPDESPVGNELDGNSATNDICPGNSNNKGFRYSRTDAWVDLNDATLANLKPLRAHDWHRFTLSYNSNSDVPYTLWIDGRQITGIVFQSDPTGVKGFLNDGSHEPDLDIPQTSASEDEYVFYRSTTKLLEVNPEDRLTVGCIFRRQPDITNSTVYTTHFEELADAGTSKYSRPVFKFDSNLVAVANATIDDFRISTSINPAVQTPGLSDMIAYSRYEATTSPYDGVFYENGFLPENSSGALLAAPVRLGTLSWTEYRPDWDPYNGRGYHVPESARVVMTWAVYKDIRELKRSDMGERNDFSAAERSGIQIDPVGNSTSSENYWAMGGMSLQGAVLESGNEVGALLYRANFVGPNAADVVNVTAYLDDVTVTLLTPPRKLAFLIDY